MGFLSGPNNNEARERVHPTQNPTSILADILTRWHKAGGVVVDPLQTGRVCYGIEIDPGYVDVIRQRYADYVGIREYSPRGELTKDAGT